MMTVPGADGCDQLVDYEGDITRMMHKGKELVYLPAAEGDDYRSTQVVRNGRQGQTLVLCIHFQ